MRLPIIILHSGKTFTQQTHEPAENPGPSLLPACCCAGNIECLGGVEIFALAGDKKRQPEMAVFKKHKIKTNICTYSY